MARLRTQSVTLRYDKRTVSTDLSVSIPDGGFTVIVGANACGKSTLLRGLSRLLRPASGEIILDGKTIETFTSRELARQLGLLPQSATAPVGITVGELVGRGRFPHQSFLRQWSTADQLAVENAMQATGVSQLANVLLEELSGGQRQRVWIAMVLAQDTSILLLDEPTTFLDIAFQIEVLDLLAELNIKGRTIVAVLHDLNHACRYATHLIAMRDGRIVAEGRPADIVSADLVEDVYGLSSMIITDPYSNTPMIVPKGRLQMLRKDAP